MSEKYSDISAWLECFLQNRADIVPMFAPRIGLLVRIFRPRFRHRPLPRTSLGWSRLAASMTAEGLECDTPSVSDQLYNFKLSQKLPREWPGVTICPLKACHQGRGMLRSNGARTATLCR
jgi:hypothetical protein